MLLWSDTSILQTLWVSVRYEMWTHEFWISNPLWCKIWCLGNDENAFRFNYFQNRPAMIWGLVFMREQIAALNSITMKLRLFFFETCLSIECLINFPFSYNFYKDEDAGTKMQTGFLWIKSSHNFNKSLWTFTSKTDC